MSIAFLLIGDPIWLIAAANFINQIGIALPGLAVWLLHRDRPGMCRPYRAPRGILTDDQQRVQGRLKFLLRNETLTVAYLIVRPDGSERRLEDRAPAIIGPGGLPVRIDGVASDISDRKLDAERLTFQANHDAVAYQQSAQRASCAGMK